MLSLTDKLKQLREQQQQELPNAFTSQTAQELDNLINNGIKYGLRKGEYAPDFSLPDALGNTVTLSSHLEKGPVILSFYRGSW